MRSVTGPRFRKQFGGLPAEVRIQAKVAYQRWKIDPFHPGLHFSRVHPTEPIYSVRIGIHWTAVALVEDNIATWIWIGSHSDYDRLLDSL